MIGIRADWSFARVGALSVVVVACLGLALGVTARTAGARPSEDSKAAYVRSLEVAYTNFAKVGRKIDKAIRQADKKSDKKAAKQFRVLARQTRAARDRIARLRAPPTVGGQHKLLVRAISGIARDLDDIGRLGRKGDLVGVRRSGERLFSDLRALARARNALVRTLEGETPPAEPAAVPST